VDIYLELSESKKILIGEVDHDSIEKTQMSLMTGKSEINGFMKLVGSSEIFPMPTNYQSMCNILGITGKDAALAVPKESLRAHLKTCVEGIQNALCDTENSDYLVTYLTIKRFLQGLSRSSIDLPKLKGMIEETEYETVKSTLSSFLPAPGSLCNRVEYSTVNTSTGRLTVTGGPQILTAPARVRSCLKSRYPGGKVIQIDLVSAEPKFALHVKGDDIPVDVYEFVANTILKSQVERSHAKLITLCALYGQSPKNLEKKLPECVNARSVIRQARNYFDYDRLKRRLALELSSNNLRNAVGRPLKIQDNNEHLLISYYLQSSVAEGSLLMFAQFSENFSDYCSPLFVIHDALIIDCQKEFAESLLKNETIELSLGDWKFDASVKVLEDN